MNGLHPCKCCGAPLGYDGERVRGGYHHPDVPLDAYEAINLLEALKLVKQTGDWHGQLRFRCEAVIKKYGGPTLRPNATAEQMRIDPD
jgi:hypothetical protein